MRKTRVREELYRINQKGEMKDLVRFHLCGTTFPDKNYKICRPNSSVWCIEYVEEGSGTVNLGDETFFPKAGDSYFLHAQKDQFYFANKSDPWKKHFINISGKLVENLIVGYGVADVAHFVGLDLGKEIKQIIEIARQERMDNTPELIVILNDIFLKMHVNIKKNDGIASIGMKMKDFLNTQITSNFRLELLCKHISRSESQTIRIFKTLYGITPYAYIINKKIDFAKKLFIDTNLSVKEIADKLCFADEYYFSNIFKKKVGCCPSQYRMVHTEGNGNTPEQ